MLVHLKVRPAQRPRSACLRGRPCRMSRASGLALAAVLVVLCAGRLAAAQLDPGREADPPCKKAAASQDPDGEELVGLFSTKTKELLDDKGAAHAKPAVVVVFMNLDGGKKQTQYVLKRARKFRGGAQGPRLRRRLPEGQQGRHGGWHGQKGPCSQPLVWPTLLEQCLRWLRAALWARVGSHPARTTTKRDCGSAAVPAYTVPILPVWDHPGGLRARCQVGLRRTHGHHPAHAQQGPEACGEPGRCSWCQARILRVDRRLQRDGACRLCRRVPRGRAHRAHQAGPKRRAVGTCSSVYILYYIVIDIVWRKLRGTLCA